MKLPPTAMRIDCVYKLTRSEFRADATRSRLLLEDISGTPVIGYRAPGFSSTEATPWFFYELCDSGYVYDSSVFPARRGHRRQSSQSAPSPFCCGRGLDRASCQRCGTRAGKNVFLWRRLLAPFPLLHHPSYGQTLDGKWRSLMFYIHPREIDPQHPRMPMPYTRRFKSYVNLHTTEAKIRHIVRDFPLTTCRDFLFGSGSELSYKKPVLSAIVNPDVTTDGAFRVPIVQALPFPTSLIQTPSGHQVRSDPQAKSVHHFSSARRLEMWRRKLARQVFRTSILAVRRMDE